MHLRALRLGEGHVCYKRPLLHVDEPVPAAGAPSAHETERLQLLSAVASAIYSGAEHEVNGIDIATARLVQLLPRKATRDVRVLGGVV